MSLARQPSKRTAPFRLGQKPPAACRALDNYLEHYHNERPHQGKGNVILFPRKTHSDPPRAEPVLCDRRLGGLLKFYYRKAG